MDLLWLWIVLGVMGFLALATLTTAFICYRLMLYSGPRRLPGEGEYEIPVGDIYTAFRDDMIAWTKMIRAFPYKEYAIQSHDGLTLRAKFYEYEAGAPIELMFHGYRGYAERDLSGGVERCFQLGHSALLIDHRGAGLSDGNLITFGILERRDCLSWVDFAVEEFGSDARLILSGISMGAATVMMAAGTDLPSQIQYVLADCGYTSPKEIISKVMVDMKLPPRLLYPFASMGARLFGHFNLNEYSPMEAMRECKMPVVFAHGDADDFVPYDMSVRLFEACTGRHKKLVTIHGAGHGLAFPVAQEEYVEALKEFKRECGFDF